MCNFQKMYMEKHILIKIRKEGHADFFRDKKGPITIDFLGNDITVNRACYCQILRENSPYLLLDLYIYIYIYIYHQHHHYHQIMLLVQSFLTLSLHPFLSFIALGRSSKHQLYSDTGYIYIYIYICDKKKYLYIIKKTIA